jgi:hypothetical protein
MFGEEREAWEKEQAGKQASALKKQQQHAKRLAKIVPGDYQVQIHVIEARDLKPQVHVKKGNEEGEGEGLLKVSCNLSSFDHVFSFFFHPSIHPF